MTVSQMAQVKVQEGVDDANDEADAARGRALLLVGLEDIASLNEREAAKLMHVLGHGDKVGVWSTPSGWLPPGRRQAAVNIKDRILNFLPTALQEVFRADTALMSRAELLVTQYAIMLRMGPSGTGRSQGRSLSPGTIKTILFSHAPRIIALGLIGITSSISADGKDVSVDEYQGPLLASITLAQLRQINGKAYQMALKECQRMYMLASRGFWVDLPGLEGEARSTVLAGTIRFNPPEGPKNPHLPLPDEFVSKLGKRCLWLMEDLGPNLFRFGEILECFWHRPIKDGLQKKNIRDRRRKAVRMALKEFIWKDSTGDQISQTPFPLKLSTERGFAKNDSALKKGKPTDEDAASGEMRWPPRNHSDFIQLIYLVQYAHACVVLLSMGGRQSEFLSLQRDCVTHAVDGRAYANGRTYKLTQRIGGVVRDWQLPDVAVGALEQQSRLVALSERFGSLSSESTEPVTTDLTHLWGQINSGSHTNPTNPLAGLSRTFVSFPRRIGLEAQPGGQNLRSHRFRKTVARLVALALTQAPKLLMDVFGHKSLEMTLYYILTDKDLQAEIETVTRELRVMRAKEAVDKMVNDAIKVADDVGAALGGYGGLAAVAIRDAVEVQRQRVHRRGEDWDARSAYELAELLTLQGKAWDQVREGVICTKFVGEAGPCNKSKGRPEPSKCDSACVHRLEEEFLREDVDGALRECVAAYERSIADDESLTASHWAGQIRSHVVRFSDLQDKWMAHPTVCALMSPPGASA